MTRYALALVIAAGAFAYATYERLAVYPVRGVTPGVWDLLVDTATNPFFTTYVLTACWSMMVAISIQHWSIEVSLVRHGTSSRFLLATLGKIAMAVPLALGAVLVGTCVASVGLQPAAVAPEGGALDLFRSQGFAPLGALTFALIVSGISLVAVGSLLLASWYQFRSGALQAVLAAAIWLWALVSASGILPALASFAPTTFARSPDLSAVMSSTVLLIGTGTVCLALLVLRGRKRARAIS